MANTARDSDLRNSSAAGLGRLLHAYRTPSAVANELCRTKRGTRTQLNGKADWVLLADQQKRMPKEAKAS